MYVEQATFRTLILGLFDGLEAFFLAQGLDATFPSLRREGDVQQFTEYMNLLRQTIEARQDPMTLSEASSVVNRLLEKNEATLQIPEPVLCQRMGNGAMNRLDEFSSIIWPHDKAIFERTTRGKFYGVGVRIAVVNSELTVVSPLAGSPAFKAGIRTGDTIVTIAGKKATGIDLNRAVDLITGPEGTTVDLGIRPAGSDSVRNVTLTRQPINVVSCKGWSRKPNGDWDFYIDAESRIGYVRLTGFGPTTAEELDDAIRSMSDDRGVNGLIIDLRFNPGGRLDAAVDITNRFIDTGTIVSTTKQMFPGRPWRAPADSTDTYEPFPLAILINDGSASASEIVSGALQVHGRALVVGATSYGKGSVQNLFHVGGRKAYLKLTTQYYKLPNDRIIHRRKGATNWGIKPGMPVRMSDQQVRDLISARMLMDVLHDPDEAEDNFNADLLFSDPTKTEDPDAPDEVARLNMLEKIKDFTSPDEILINNLDPQLEAALLLMKVKSLGEPRANPQLATP
jgi:carboxyl-terminal processing protease